MPPLLFATFRYLLSAVFLLAYAIATTDDWWPDTTGDRLDVLDRGVFFIGGTDCRSSVLALEKREVV